MTRRDAGDTISGSSKLAIDAARRLKVSAKTPKNTSRKAPALSLANKALFIKQFAKGSKNPKHKWKTASRLF